jgi:adenylate kinase
MLNLVIFGPPGCGKGTQSGNIIRKYGLYHISTGEILREEISIHSAIGEVIRKFIDRGFLVPNDIVLREIRVCTDHHIQAKGLLFDGFPRTVFQATYLDDLLHSRNHEICKAIYLNVEEEELFNRVRHRSENSQRSDDSDEVLQNRISIYQQETFPLVEYYRKQGKLAEVSGMASVDEVFQRIDSHIQNCVKKK